MRAAIAAAVTIMVAATALSSPSSVADAEAARARPNIVLILVDDMRTDHLAHMSKTRKLLERRGARFSRAYAVNPLCCPSRASILTGQYAHNTGVMDNRGADGGFGAFEDDETVASWLNRAGYVTGFIGKYLNGYDFTAPNHEPPGWDVWRVGIVRPFDYTGPTTYNVNGRRVKHRGYQTDVLSRMARGVVRRSARRGSPFLLFLSYLAPHVGLESGVWGPPVPAKRHRNAHNGVALPRGPGFNEPDMRDKPASLRSPRLSRQQVRAVRALHERRLESLLAVDEGVAALVKRLKSSGVLSNTYIVFTSDNGFFAGEHRIPDGKVLPYEPSARVPLLVRGPGVPRGVVRRQIVGLHDLAPTFLRWARARAHRKGSEADGRNLMPLIRHPHRRSHRDLLIEGKDDRRRWRQYDAIRTHDWKYVEYVTGATEMYRLRTDPHETRNLTRSPSFDAQQAKLSARLAAVRDCVAAGCR